VLHDEVPIQSPNVLVYRIQQLLSERVPSGKYRFTEFDSVDEGPGKGPRECQWTDDSGCRGLSYAAR